MRLRRRPEFEAVATDRAQSFALRTAEAAHGWSFAWHHHPEWELTLILAGSGSRCVGDSVEDFAAGDCCLIGPDVPHTWMSRPAGLPGRAVVCQFPEALVADLAVWPEGGDVRRLLAQAAGGLRLDLPATLAGELRRLAGETPGLGRLLGLVALLDNLARVPASPLGAAAEADPRLGRVLRLVEERGGPGPSQVEAATVAGLTPAAFSRWFRQRTGRTFAGHRVERRLAGVCRDLLAGDERIIDLAFRWGWDGLAAFNRAFRARHGCAPSAWRRAQRSASACMTNSVPASASGIRAG